MMADSEVSFSTQLLSNIENVLPSSMFSYLLAGVVLILTVYWRFTKKINLPPGPIGFPIFGYLPFLGSEPYRGLHNLSEKYGNIFGLYMGRTYVVILADFPVVKEAFSKSTTTDRPEKVFDFIPDGVGFSSVNGEEWVEQRRYSVKAMRNLGLGRSSWESLVQDEVDDFVDLVSKHNGRPFDICRLLTASVSNNISTLVFGRRLKLNDQTIEFLNRSIDSVSQFAAQVGLRNSFPMLYDALTAFGFTNCSTYQKNLMEFNRYIKNEVDCHRKEDIKENEEDFIDGYLMKIKENRENNLANTFNETNLHGNIQALFIGASDTTRTSLNWLLVTMAKYLDIQTKVHEELDRVLGTEGKIQWSERASLPFTYAVIMEGQRWKTVAPLNTARIAMEDIELGGYEIPKGTTIIANNWGLHHDTKYWNDPEKFFPERFLSADGKQVNFKPESYVPFSYGKRNCPGETVGMMEILFYFVALLKNFLVLPPEGKVPKMEAILGLTYQAVPQELRFVKRK